MFNPFKNAGELQKLWKLQQEVKKIEVSSQKGNVEVTVTGEMKVKSVRVDGRELSEVKDALNTAFAEVQKKVASKMQEVGGGLQGLLGK